MPGCVVEALLQTSPEVLLRFTVKGSDVKPEYVINLPNVNLKIREMSYGCRKKVLLFNGQSSPLRGVGERVKVLSTKEKKNLFKRFF